MLYRYTSKQHRLISIDASIHNEEGRESGLVASGKVLKYFKLAHVGIVLEAFSYSETWNENLDT